MNRTMRELDLVGVAVFAGLIGWFGAGANAWAGPVPGCRAQVRVIGASMKPAPLPKALKVWSRKLRQPPFSLFKSFKLIKTIDRDLTKNRSVTAVLAGPYVLTLELLSRAAGKRIRYRFRLKLTARKGKHVRVISSSTLRMDSGGTFFVAGPRLGPQTLILGITLTERAATAR
ncbi:MAG: hypothetical protein J7M25_12335 [Deltaproteobacteria bacterium]|nr:hypothetical protein [Deltaproteobacteria bacterium]